ncbi:MAG: dockerin type I domain-containing protein [Phycisphaerales bacterium]
MSFFGLSRMSIAAALLASAGVATTLSAQVAPSAADLSLSRANFLEANPEVGFFELNGEITRIYGKAFSQGASAVESADAFLRQHAGILKSDFNQLMAIGPNGDGTHVLPLGYDANDGSYRFSLVGYTQHVNGVPVFRGDVRCLVRNEPGYPLVLVSNALKDVRAFAAGFNGGPIAPSQLDLRKASRAAFNQFGPGAVISDQEQVIWAGYDDAPAAEARLAYKFIVTGTGVFDRTARQRMLYVVDAQTNKILFQEDQIVHADINLNISGQATQGTAADACNPEAITGLPYAGVVAGATTYYADVNGNVVIPNAANANLTLTATIGGRWFSVNDSATGTESVVSTTSTGGVVQLVHNAPNTLADERAEVNAYLQANMVRDYTLAYNPSFPTIGTQVNWPINVQVAGTCNAFYDGVSINFYPAGGGCNNTAFSVVVHHEYGHHLVNRAGSGQGAYGEGYGDVIGVLVTDESRLAVGFQTCTTGIRDANNNCQYSATGCSSCGTEIHACGMLLSGCVWSVRNNLVATNPSTYRQILSNLAVDSVLLHTGTGIAGDITIDFLTLNDNDANIGNGTPNYNEINNGFTAHGLPGPALQLISIAFPDGQPALSNPAGGTTFRVNVNAAAGQPVAGSGRLFYRLGTTGAFTNVAMSETTANQYVATLPPATCGSSIQYYVQATAVGGSTAVSPTGAPASFYSSVVANGLATPFVDTVETVTGWTTTTAGDTATAGLWTRGDPLGTVNGTVEVQPDLDVSNPGVNCFFTGQGAAGAALGAADVDGGLTTLTSPTMDASAGDAFISYSRWYSNSQGGAPNADTFRVQISNNNGASWVALETVGPAGAEVNGGWIAKEFRIADFVTPTNQMKIRFLADDVGTGSLIEAAVDEVRIRVVECTPVNPADLNDDGFVDAADLAIMLNNWNGIGIGDINQDGGVDATDLALILNAWGS